MSTFTSTLKTEDGREVKDGSPLAVELYESLMREAQDKVNEAHQLLARCPDEVEQVWRREFEQLRGKLSRHVTKVSRFETDFSKRGLDFAVGEAQHRKDL